MEMGGRSCGKAPSFFVLDLTGDLISSIISPMRPLQVVMDTNVLVAALRSRRGASHKLLMLTGGDRFELALSVPLVLEYEDAAMRLVEQGFLTAEDIGAILDYMCAVAHHQQVFYLWRPFLSDPKDDMVLELAVAAGCEFVVTYNKADFRGAEQFGLRVVTPQEFLHEIGGVA